MCAWCRRMLCAYVYMMQTTCCVLMFTWCRRHVHIVFPPNSSGFALVILLPLWQSHGHSGSSSTASVTRGICEKSFSTINKLSNNLLFQKNFRNWFPLFDKFKFVFSCFEILHTEILEKSIWNYAMFIWLISTSASKSRHKFKSSNTGVYSRNKNLYLLNFFFFFFI